MSVAHIPPCKVAVVLAAVVAVCLCSTQQGKADPPPGYYDSVDTTDAASLRATLHEVIDDHTRFPYSSSSTDTWDILETAQEDSNNSNNVIDVYRNRSYTKIGGGQGPYNREHTWPKSYGFPDDNSGNYPYTDCHQLYLCDSDYNSFRGNNPFRYCNAGCTERTTDLNNGQGGGSGTYPGNSNWHQGTGPSGTWETWIGRRGDIARAQLYLDVRYEGGVHGVTGASEPDLILTDSEALIAASSTGNNESVAYMGMLSVLLQWHLEDPVDALEMAENDVVFGFQGNRNPFVDHPEWVDCLFNNACGPYGDGDFNGDSDVDLSDCAAFQRCFGLTASGGCEPGNLVGDQMIDLADFDAFEALMGGPT
jgi:endonuclease I